jgi:L-gulonolactone oxidase
MPGCCATTVIVLVALLAAGLVPVYRRVGPLYGVPYHRPFDLDAADGKGIAAFCNFDRRQCCNGTVHRPESVDEVAAIVAEATAAGKKVRVVGGGHSMSPLVCGGFSVNDGALAFVSLDAVDRVLAVDRAAGTATVEAGKRLRDFNRALAELDLSLYNMGLIDEQAIAGLTATGVHGTGDAFGTVSTAVVSMDVALANGTVATFSDTTNPGIFKFARVHLGIFGVVVRLTMRVRPLVFIKRTHRYVPMPELLANFDTLSKAQRNFQAWWVTYTPTAQVNDMVEVTAKEAAALRRSPWSLFLKKLTTDVSFYAMSRVVKDSFADYVFQLLPLVQPPEELAGPIHEMLMYPGINFHSVLYSETEYFVPRDRAMAAVAAADNFTRRERARCPVNAMHPIRTVKGDDVPHSPLSGRDCVAISFVMIDQPAEFDVCSRLFEDIMISFGGRPHWGKRNTLNRAKAVAMYGAPALDGLRAAARAVDPLGHFMTPHLANVLDA